MVLSNYKKNLYMKKVIIKKKIKAKNKHTSFSHEWIYEKIYVKCECAIDDISMRLKCTKISTHLC